MFQNTIEEDEVLQVREAGLEMRVYQFPEQSHDTAVSDYVIPQESSHDTAVSDFVIKQEDSHDRAVTDFVITHEASHDTAVNDFVITQEASHDTAVGDHFITNESIHYTAVSGHQEETEFRQQYKGMISTIMNLWRKGYIYIYIISLGN